MRVIAGKCRRLLLKSFPGNEVRPTTDKIKETLFNMLNPRLEGAAFLDVCAGTGGIGIEALSRGADRAVFVEKNRAVASLIKENLEHTKLTDQAAVMLGDAVYCLRQLGGRGEKFDIIFIDPPYDQGIEAGILETIMNMKLIADDGLIVVEASKATEFDYALSLGLKIDKEKIYGSNKHLFFTAAD